MRAREFALAVLASAVTGLTACSGGNPSAPGASAGGELPASVTDTLEKVLSQPDPTAFGQLLADNARILPPNVPAVAGRDAILDYYKGAVTPELHWDLVPGKSYAIGEAGILEGAYHIKNSATGQEVETGKFLSVWVNQNGTWKLLRMMDSADHAVAQGSGQVAEPAPAAPPKP